MRKVLLITVTALSLLFTTGVLSASAEVLGLLDDVWFKLNVKFTGKQYDVNTESLSNQEFTFIAYLHTTSDGGDGYNYELYTKNAKRVWEKTGDDSLGISVSGRKEKFLILTDNNFGDWKKKEIKIQFYQTSIIQIKRKGNGSFKSAKFTSLGAEVYEGENDSGTMKYYGGAKVTGESIKAKELPFGGVLYFSQDSNSDGLYRLDIFTGVATLVGASGVAGSTVGLAYRPDKDFLYGSKWSELLKIARDGSGAVDKGGEGTEGLAYDPIKKVLYGAINRQFFTIKKSNGSKIEDLTGPGFDAEGIAVDPKTGVVYAIGDSTLLRKYDPDTDTWSDVGDTGLDWAAGGLAYNPGLHMLYACGSNQGNDLYTIDPDTAETAKIGDSGVTLEGGLAFAPGVTP